MKSPPAVQQFIANDENEMEIRIPEELDLSSGWSEVSDRFIEKVQEWRFFISKLYCDKPLQWLELGSYEGRSTVVTVLNFLQHPESKLVAIDDWHYGESEIAFDKNIEASRCKDKINKIKSDWFPAIKQLSGNFDVIFVDADHKITSVVTQMAMLWPHLKKSGLMIIDDYQYQASHEMRPLREGIDAFLNVWNGEYKLLRKGWQVILQKI